MTPRADDYGAVDVLAALERAGACNAEGDYLEAIALGLLVLCNTAGELVLELRAGVTEGGRL